MVITRGVLQWSLLCREHVTLTQSNKSRSVLNLVPRLSTWRYPHLLLSAGWVLGDRRALSSKPATCHPAEVAFPPLPQLNLVLDLATPEGCKAELTFRNIKAISDVCGTSLRNRLWYSETKSQFFITVCFPWGLYCVSNIIRLQLLMPLAKERYQVSQFGHVPNAWQYCSLKTVSLWAVQGTRLKEKPPDRLTELNHH